jgi:hypothetical protein
MKMEDFDVLITDLDYKKLQCDILELLGVPYLSKATEANAKRVVEVGEAIIYGESYRTIFPCIINTGAKTYWVFLSWTQVLQQHFSQSRLYLLLGNTDLN